MLSINLKLKMESKPAAEAGPELPPGFEDALGQIDGENAEDSAVGFVKAKQDSEL